MDKNSINKKLTIYYITTLMCGAVLINFLVEFTNPNHINYTAFVWVLISILTYARYDSEYHWEKTKKKWAYIAEEYIKEIENKNHMLIKYLFPWSLTAYLLIFISSESSIIKTDWINYLGAITLTLVYFSGMYLLILQNNVVKKYLCSDSELDVNSSAFSEFRDNHINWIVVPMVMIIYILVRISYINNTFGSAPHADKYATHIPVVQNMYKVGTPFFYENPAYISVFQSSSVRGWFGGFPFFEWGIYPLMTLTKFIRVEILVRSFLSLCGIALAILFYMILSKILSRELAIIGTILLVVNPMFQLITYLTIMDLPALIFMFSALLAYKSDNRNLSYILAGLSVYMKLSFLLLTAPVITLLLLSEEKYKLYEILKLGVLLLLPTFLLHPYLIEPLPSLNLQSALVNIILFLTIISSLYILIERKEQTVELQIEKIDYKYRYAVIPILPIAGVIILWDTIIAYTGSYITTPNLIFNLEIYQEIILESKEYMPDPIYYLAPLGILFSTTDSDHRWLSLGLIASAVTYLVVGSPSVYVHIYYKHIFVIVSILYLLYVLRGIDQFYSFRSTVSVIFVVILILSVPAINGTDTMLQEDRFETEDAGQYLQNNVQDNEKIIINQPISRIPANIYSKTNSPFVAGGSEKLQQQINRNGFKTVMKKNNIKYYVSFGEGRFDYFTPLLTNGSSSAYNREELIINQTTNADRKEGMSVDPSQYFVLEEQIGVWRIYRVRS